MDFLKSKIEAVVGGASDVADRATLPEVDVIEGLKEALDHATKAAVELVSGPGGFLNDAAIRIPVPAELEKFTDGLRLIPGASGQVEDFEKAMNAAAEAAAKHAYDVFGPVIKAMTIEKAVDILNGDERAATTYFEKGTRTPLHAKFFPIVEECMKTVGLVEIYEKIMEAFAQLPIFDKPDLQLSEFVTGKALDGLFAKLGLKEKEIREHPAARVTPMMAKVFGSK